MDWKLRVDYVRRAISELKEDIAILQKNIETAESLLDSINCEEDTIKFAEFDIERGLRHIEIFD